MVNYELPNPASSESSHDSDPHLAPRRTLEGRVSLEIRGKYHLFLTDDCPPALARFLTDLSTEEAVSEFIAGLRQLATPSRRKVFQPVIYKFPGLENVSPIFKQKAEKPNDPKFPGLNIVNFTTNVFHEMETAYAMDEILRQRAADLPQIMEYLGEEYQVSYQVQKPWGALVDSTDPTVKFGIFEYIDGQSVRAEAASYGLWNDIPEEYRKLYGRFSTLINEVANVCVAEGLEPWDLGIHQLIYTLDENNKRVSLGVVDTEEFNFSADGEFWPESFSRIGLPPILLLSMLFNAANYDD